MIKLKEKANQNIPLTFSDQDSMRSYLGWLKWCDSYRLRKKYSNFWYKI